MANCRSCREPIPASARYCPHCGISVIVETLDCPSCGHENELGALQCGRCSRLFYKEKKEKAGKTAGENIFQTSGEGGLTQEIADRFSIAFEKRMEEEVRPSLHNTYIDRFHQSDFRKNLEFRIRQLAEAAQAFGSDDTRKAALLNPAFEDLLDYFMIQYCRDLNEVRYPERMLRWQGIPAEKLKLDEIIGDYLDFEQEHESVFTDFVTMPPAKLKNAASQFLFPQKGESIYFICDLSMLGQCKEGFAMTSRCIYWKMPFEKKQRVYYKNLDEIKREKDGWITINGIFFNANKSLNLKLIRLLKKLKWYARQGVEPV